MKHPQQHSGGVCDQDPRLTNLETTQERILETLKTLTDLLTSSVRSEERIATLQTSVSTLEKRLHSVEKQTYAAGWIHKLAMVAAGVILTGWLSLQGGGK